MSKRQSLTRQPPPIPHSFGSVLALPLGAAYVRDWTRLRQGDLILIAEIGMLGFAGEVDIVTEDGRILWLYLEGGAGRRLFTHTDGVRLWRVPTYGF